MLCKKYNLLLIEDCAQAHFAEYKGQRVGTFGLAGTFSFYPGKNLGAYGDAGAIITNDDNLAVKMRMYANHGRIAKYDHEFEGRNSRLDGIQAAILDIKLRYLDNWTAKRIEIAEMYYDGLRNIGDVILPKREKWAKHVYHLFVIRSNKRDELQKHLNKNKIETGIHYPIALPKLEAYNHLDRFDYSMFSCKIDSEILSLPIGEHLDKNELEVLIQNILGFFQ
jgi:dTDP-4-amino-4,6-dideoxygalactose transaminase